MGEIHKYVNFFSKPYPRRPRLVADTSLQILSEIGFPETVPTDFVVSEETGTILFLVLNLNQRFFVSHTHSCSIE